MNNTEIAWARLHDWYRGVTYNGGVLVYDSVSGEEIVFNNWIKLKVWAGY